MATMTSTGKTRWLKWIAILVGLAVLAAVAAFVWYVWIRDTPDPLDESDLDAALTQTTTTLVATAPGTEPGMSAATATPATAPDAAGTTTGASADGATTWSVVSDASTVGYRVNEVLFGVDTAAVGRTDQVTGSLQVDGTTLAAAEFTVDVASITSDESRRDGQFNGPIMSTSDFPTATFVLTAPVELGTEPAEGAEVTVDVTGDLTLRGVTNPVTFELTGKVTGGQIGVLGNIPVLFADYGIANPTRPGITTEDNGLLEFVIVFAEQG